MSGLFKKYKTGVALSGGGVRGIAHLGVLKALKEEGIKPSILAGTSAGALIAAFYADGYEPEEIIGFFNTKKIYHLMRMVLPRTGFLQVHGLREILTKNLRTKRIEDLPIPLVIAVTNFNIGKVEYLTHGDLIQSLLSSSAIPILFEAQKMDGNYYLDGGIMDNLPVNPIKDKCRKIIAVHVNPIGSIDKISSPIQIGERAFHLSIASNLANIREKVDLFIEPPELSKYGMLDIKKITEIYDTGYRYTKEYLAK